MTIIYDIFRWIGVFTGYPFKWIFFKTKSYYESEKAPRRVRGGALIISNHFNLLDYIQNALIFFPRKLYVVASEYAFKNALIRFGMKFWGGIQANRITKSMQFVTESVRKIRDGYLVQIFPEGHNTDDGTIKPFYSSYILIALRANAPIIPVISDGNYGLFKQVHLIIGEPIDLNNYLSSEKVDQDEIIRLNEIVYAKVLQLRKELDLRIGAKRKKREH